jgi:hypothetical protein
MAIQLITAQYENMLVLFQSDAFINATAIAKQFGKRTENYLRTDETKAYIAALEKYLFSAENSVAPKSVTKQNQLVIVKQGGVPEEQGTWLHPKLTIHFARWLSADFAVWCDLQIEKILQTHTVPDNFSEFLQPITDPITLEDFNWRHQLITKAWQNLQNAKVVIMLNGSELLVGKRLAKSKRLF